MKHVFHAFPTSMPCHNQVWHSCQHHHAGACCTAVVGGPFWSNANVDHEPLHHVASLCIVEWIVFVVQPQAVFFSYHWLGEEVSQAYHRANTLVVTWFNHSPFIFSSATFGLQCTIICFTPWNDG